MSPERRLRIALGVLAVAAATLALARGLSSTPAESAPAASRLIAPERSTGWTIAALTVERAGELPFVYGRVQGRWRCLTRGRALVEQGAAEALVEALLAAHVSPRGRTADPAQYGLDGEPRLRVSLHGPAIGSRPDRDVLFTVECGEHLAGLGTTFVRLAERPGVHALELDLVERLESPPELPPLIETRLVPSDWSGLEVGVAEVEIERADGLGSTVLRELPLPGQTEVEVRWRLTPTGGSPREPEHGLVALYVAFLLRAPFEALVEADVAAAAGPFEARVVLAPLDGGPSIELSLLPPLADGRRVVLRSPDQLAVEIEPELAAVLAAAPDQLTDLAQAPPWERWLRLTLPQAGAAPR